MVNNYERDSNPTHRMCGFVSFSLFLGFNHTFGTLVNESKILLIIQHETKINLYILETDIKKKRNIFLALSEKIIKKY